MKSRTVLVLLYIGLISFVSGGSRSSECALRCGGDSSVNAEISDGCLCGTMMPGYGSASPFQAFLGIPFAKPPVANLRFANPRRNDPWTGLYNASTPKSPCIQKNDFSPDPTIEGEEDCLYLNVYRPANSPESLPVMAYIHGGGYIAGTAHPSYTGPGKFMATGKVIVVTFQYRLGALGFLSTGDREASGNFGLKDQSMALRWISRNIRKFGGDPKRVTLFGQSAGACSVQFHMVSRLSKGLFSKAISQSGSMLAYWNRPTEDLLKLVRKQAEVLGILWANRLYSYELVDALRQVSARDLVASVDKLKYWYNEPLILYTPVVEQDVDEKTFLRADPADLWAAGRFEKVPWMTGVLPNEGGALTLGVISNDTKLASFVANQQSLLPKIAGSDASHNSEFLERFFNGAAVDTTNADGMSKMASEAAFLYPMMQSVTQYFNIVGKYPTVYYFNFTGRYFFSAGYTGQAPTPKYGIVHGEDLLYLWQMPAYVPEFPPGSPEEAMSKLFVDQFVTFAERGKMTVGYDCDCTRSSKKFRIVEFSNSDSPSSPVKTSLVGKRCQLMKYLKNVLEWWSNKM